MKKLLKASFVISLLVNLCLFIDWRNQKTKEQQDALVLKYSRIGNSNWSEGFKLLKSELENTAPLCAEKEYYYISTWTSFCAPCIKEMPLLDSMASTIEKNVAFVFVTELPRHTADSFVKKHQIHCKNFVFIHDMNSFISGVCNEKEVQTIIYPMHIIARNNGELINYSEGAYENVQEAREFINKFNRIN